MVAWFEDVRLGERWALGAWQVGPVRDPFVLLSYSVGAPFARTSVLDSQCSRFVQPVRSGDWVYPVLQVVVLTPCRGHGLVVVRSTMHNQDRALLIEGEQHYRVPCRPYTEQGVADPFGGDKLQPCALYVTH